MSLDRSDSLLVLAFCALLLIPAECPAQMVTGSGMGGTIPVWSGTGTVSVLGSPTATDVTASKNLFIFGPAPWIDVKAYGAKGDGTTDDTSAITMAIAACPPSGSTTGCTVFFPADPGSYLVSSSSGPALTINTPNIILKGECAPAQSIYTACSQLVDSSGTTSILAVAPSTGVNNLTGFRIQDLGFQDISTSNTLAGAVQLSFVNGFVFDDLYCDNFASGYCMQFVGSQPDSGNGFTQFGTILDPYTTNTKFPIQTNGLTSSISLFGGELNCAALNATWCLPQASEWTSARHTLAVRGPRM